MSTTRSIFSRLDWINVFYLIATPVASVILVPLYLYREGFSWQLWLVFGILSILTSTSITAGYHRLFSHVSYEASPWVRAFFILFGAAAFQGSVLKWCTDHRRHHRFVDTEDDPYNIQQGFWYAHIGWLIMEDNPKFKDQFAPDLANDWMISIQHKYYLVFAVLMGFGFPIFLGYLMGSILGGVAVLACLRLVFTNHTTFFINSFCHKIGGQPYTDLNSARDSFIMAIFAYGEGYHNYHHKFQFDYRNGIRWYHWDPTKWIVNILSWCGSARGLKRASVPLILNARLEMDQKRLINRGVPREKLYPFLLKIEEAQKKMRELKDDYRILKQNVKERSRARMRKAKMEMRLAKREFKMALSDWMIVRKYPRLVTT